MVSVTWNILTVLVIAEFVLGNFANGFIVLVNYIDWAKSHKFSLVDQIIVALSISRIGLFCVLLIVWFTVAPDTPSYSLEVFVIVNVSWTVSFHFSIWLATSLSVLYLLKIANFSSLLFLYLKRRVKRVVLIILMGSLVFFVFNLPLAITDENVWVQEHHGNRTARSKWKKIVRLSNMSVFTLASFVSFMISLTSFVLLIFSLWKHLKNMQANGKESQDPRTKVHIRAIQTMTWYLLLLAGYFVSLILPLWNSNRMRDKPVLLIFQSFTGLYPSIHSFVLIWGNKKLQQSFLSLCQLRLRLTERKRTLFALCRKQIDESI